MVDNLADYLGSVNVDVGGLVGGLVGLQESGSISASYATGVAAGGDGDDSVGGLVGYQYIGSITAGYATGAVAGGDGDDSVGGLVGVQSGTIAASYATGAVAGGVGSDAVGGLVGLQSGFIEASYATGDASGGDAGDGVAGGLVGLKSGASIAAGRAAGVTGGEGGSDRDAVGGLVGAQFGGSITESYATGTADGGDGSDAVGGLVGTQSGTITASYATGTADGGDGDGDDYVGGLVGIQSGTITASYGFGEVMGEEVEGSEGSTKPPGVSMAADLDAVNTEEAWGNVWDFGNSGQTPALRNPDGAPLPGQDDVSISGPSAVESGETVNLAGSLRFDSVTIESWRWRQREGFTVTLSGADTFELSFTAPAPNTSSLLVFELTATDSDGRQYIDRISLRVTAAPGGGGGGGGSGGGGGGGSLGPWALVALALPLLFGCRRRLHCHCCEPPISSAPFWRSFATWSRRQKSSMHKHMTEVRLGPNSYWHKDCRKHFTVKTGTVMHSI